MKKILAAVAGKAPGLAVDVIGVAGGGLVIVGVEAIYRPAAFILAGVALICCAWLLSKRAG